MDGKNWITARVFLHTRRMLIYPLRHFWRVNSIEKTNIKVSIIY